MRKTFAGAVLAVLLLAPCTATAATDGRYDAEIRRTQGGMPHIKAHDFGSLGFGYAYAYAEDQACRFADIMATVSAKRSRHFGADASYGDLGGQANNLASDFFYQRINDSRARLPCVLPRAMRTAPRRSRSTTTSCAATSGFR